MIDSFGHPNAASSNATEARDCDTAKSHLIGTEKPELIQPNKLLVVHVRITVRTGGHWRRLGARFEADGVVELAPNFFAVPPNAN